MAACTLCRRCATKLACETRRGSTHPGIRERVTAVPQHASHPSDCQAHAWVDRAAAQRGLHPRAELGVVPLAAHHSVGVQQALCQVRALERGIVRNLDAAVPADTRTKLHSRGARSVRCHLPAARYQRGGLAQCGGAARWRRAAMTGTGMRCSSLNSVRSGAIGRTPAHRWRPLPWGHSAAEMPLQQLARRMLRCAMRLLRPCMAITNAGAR